MLSDAVVIGRITEMPEVLQEEEKIVGFMKIEVVRPFRDIDGSLIKDTVPVKLWRGLTEECIAACSEGMTVAVRGRLETLKSEDGRDLLYVLAEKMVFHLG
ncbi:MAG: single-stranded DNA-binding protein [Solobacterium sp.]|nr:single-stranded DNA-binding protein [Solobacterium sp.]